MKFTKGLYRRKRAILIGAMIDAFHDGDREAFELLEHKARLIIARGQREKGLWLHVR